MKLFITILASIISLVLVPRVQAESSWEKCDNGSTVVHCETYDCPQGDTNKDGKCTTTDKGARITDSRNDSLCINPASGCGQVLYFPANSANSCLVRVEETNNNCDLSNPTPTVTPRPTATAASSSTPKPTSTPSISNLACSELIVSPTTGTNPLKITLTAKATGKLVDISEYKFSLTDPNGKNVGLVEQKSEKLVQNLSKVGTYTANVSIIDKNNQEVTSEKCEVEIVVTDSKVLGGTDKLPETGSSLYYGLAILGMGALGVYLYEKFKFV